MDKKQEEIDLSRDSTPRAAASGSSRVSSLEMRTADEAHRENAELVSTPAVTPTSTSTAALMLVTGLSSKRAHGHASADAPPSSQAVTTAATSRRVEAAGHAR
jgi:hypothetical protein